MQVLSVISVYDGLRRIDAWFGIDLCICAGYYPATHKSTTSMKVPKRLETDLILDTAFEVRFTARGKTADLLPGMLYPNLDGAGPIQRLPLADVPASVRAANPALRGSLVKIPWGAFYVAVGDETLAIGCETPYPGWQRFKAAIEQVVPMIAGIAEQVERYSLKYIDMISTKTVAESVDRLAVTLSIGEHRLVDQSYQIRLELPQDGLINVVQLIGNATAQSDNGEKREGAVIDIDTVCNTPDELTFEQFVKELSERAERIHTVNKNLFFSCLKQETIDALGPKYD